MLYSYSDPIELLMNGRMRRTWLFACIFFWLGVWLSIEKTKRCRKSL